MKKQLITLAMLVILFSCKDAEQKDTSATNIEPEVETVSPDGSGNNSSTSASSVKGVPHFPVSEDLTLDNSVIIDLPSDKLAESVTAKLMKSGKYLNTVNSDGSVYFIGSASTGVPVNKNGFITSRNIAFAKAELRAKVELLRLTGEVVTSERNSALISRNIQGSDSDAIQKASFIEKVAAVADKSLDKALSQLGVDQSEIAQMNQSQKEKRYSENFYNYVSSFVGSMVKGVSVIKIAEGEVGSSDYEVAVAIKYSPEQQSEAANIKNLGASQKVINSETVNKLRTLSPDKLVSKLGAQFFKDENGNRFVLGFGQSSVQKSNTRQSSLINVGRRKSRLQAVENIKNLLAEDLVGKEIEETAEKISEFQDGEQALYTEDNYSELIQSKRSSIKMNTMKIKDWTGTHPISGTTVVGTVVILTESNNINLTKNTAIDNKGETKKSEYKISEDIDGEEF
jgi:hypothetical protein